MFNDRQHHVFVVLAYSSLWNLRTLHNGPLRILVPHHSVGLTADSGTLAKNSEYGNRLLNVGRLSQKRPNLAKFCAYYLASRYLAWLSWDINEWISSIREQPRQQYFHTDSTLKDKNRQFLERKPNPSVGKTIIMEKEPIQGSVTSAFSDPITPAGKSYHPLPGYATTPDPAHGKKGTTARTLYVQNEGSPTAVASSSTTTMSSHSTFSK